MKSIIMISPIYLEKSFEEAKKYTFTLQAYGSFAKACSNLFKVNVSEILGYVYLSNYVEDKKGLVDFLAKANKYGSNKKFLFALKDTSQLAALQLSQYKNLRFSVVKIEDALTDVTVNRDIFGSILLDNYKPYKLDDEESHLQMKNSLYTLKYKPIFSPYVLQCLSVIQLYDSFNETVYNDSVYRLYKQDKSVLAEFRKFYVGTFFDIEQNPEDLEVYLNDAMDFFTYGVYKALIKLIVDESFIGGV